MALSCEECGRELTTSERFSKYEGRHVCSECRNRLESTGHDSDRVRGSKNFNDRLIDSDFETLRKVGKVISIIGLLSALVWALFVIVSLLSAMTIIITFLPAFIGFWSSLLLWAFGQLIICFVSIERNTKFTYLLWASQVNVINSPQSPVGGKGSTIAPNK